MSKVEEARKILGNDYVIVPLASWNHNVDEQKKIVSRIQIAGEALKNAKEVVRCQNLRLEKNLSRILESVKNREQIDCTDIYQVKFRLEHFQNELDEALEQIRK